jgi:nucleoside-diphosphate-sugar epimerase
MTERCLVTGAAGFIGSHLAERLIGAGYEVVGIDCLRDYYSPEIKRSNLAHLLHEPAFDFQPVDLTQIDLQPIVRSVHYIFHEAGQAGVRGSWGGSFRGYVDDNILATQRLLEACKGSGVRRFVYASSSSIYGDTKDLPVTEQSLPRPVSPYGVTKLAAEHLCYLYRANYQVPTVALRYFTVYGPRQRPDMAFSRFITAICQHEPITIYGDGEQTRDFTFVADAVQANLSAMQVPSSDWRVWNIGGGSRASVLQIIGRLETLAGQQAILEFTAPQHGDVQHTWADVSAAQRDLGFAPHYRLEDGLRAQVEWYQQHTAGVKSA